MRPVRSCRPAVLACTLLLAGTLAGAAPASAARRRAPRHVSPAAVNDRRALAAYDAMQRAYYVPRAGLYRGGRYAKAWPYSQAMAATISVAALPNRHTRFRADLINRLRGLQAYADHVDPAPAGYLSEVSPPLGHGGTRYNDDNEWIAIELLRLHHINHQPALLTAAGQLFTLAFSQWDTRTDVPCPGGVPWTDLRINGDRNAVTDAPGAELGAQLYLTTGNGRFLQWARQMYGWVRGCLLNPDGLYGDHIDGEGQVDPTEWTYNQGTMIGAGVMLYRATNDSTYLAQAEATAQAALARFGPADLAQQPTYFNAIYIRNLLLLGAASGDPRYQRFAQWYAADAWANVRDPDSGLFLADPGGATQLLDQASMVQVYSLLAEPPSAFF